MSGVRQWTLWILLNGVLAFGVQASAPPEPLLSDRDKYEYAGANPLAPDCPPLFTLYCYRVLVPAALELVPVESDVRWRVHRWLAITAAGTIISAMSTALTGRLHAGAAAAILAQGSYGFAFTAYDPYSADPAVFALLAMLAWCWMRDRWRAALAIGIVGLFVKETVVLLSVAAAIAAFLRPKRASWKAWSAQALAIVTILLAYRWVMQSYFGWARRLGESASLIQIDLTRGAWLALWMEGNSPVTQVFLVFAGFAFAWFFAALGIRRLPPELRNLALGSALPFLALNYVQNPERALGNLFFLVVPLAAITLARVPAGVAITAALLNAAITARAATSSVWLPATTYLIVPAAIAAGLVFWHLFRPTAARST